MKKENKREDTIREVDKMNGITTKVNMSGRVIINGQIEAITGLHVGGSQGGIDIGGIDNYVIRDAITQQPYLPGSSLKGKIRSLLEKRYKLIQNNKVGRAYIHTCKSRNDFEKCEVCPVFGISAEEIKEKGKIDDRLITLTRIVVRDAHLQKQSIETLQKLKTDLQFTEVKTEVVIDRLTSAAVPRTMERVPAGALFDFEVIFSIYESEDVNRFAVIPEGLQLLEDDYVGGLGTRGSGQVKFKQMNIFGRKVTDYQNPVFSNQYSSIKELIGDENLTAKIGTLLN